MRRLQVLKKNIVPSLKEHTPCRRSLEARRARRQTQTTVTTSTCESKGFHVLSNKHSNYRYIPWTTLGSKIEGNCSSGNPPPPPTTDLGCFRHI